MVLQLVYCAVLLAMLSALCGLGANRFRLVTNVLCFPLLGFSGVAAVIGGLTALLNGAIVTAQLPLGLPWLHWEVRIDALSGFLLLLIGTVTTAVALYGPGYTREFRHGRSSLATLCFFTGLFVAGMLDVVIANDAFLFMVSWELMSLSSYFLVAFHHENAANRRAAFLYLLMAHVGALAILLGYGVLAAFGGSFAFDAMRQGELPLVWSSVAFGLALFGFGMKAGLVPLHAWLPEAHPVAPSHISALMSGVMLKVAVYGFIRVTFDLISTVQVSWGVVVLLIGSVSALLGVLYAMQQSDIKRLLAYSSIENIGIIFIALGLSLLFLGSGHKLLGSLGLLAALYHAFNHAVFKGLLFLGAGAVIQRSREHSIEHMGGLLRRMPYTGLFFLVGCISIASLPPFNGFASEWLTLQTALHGVVLQSGVLRIVIPVTAAMLALTGALAAMLFVRLYGVAFLGQARTRHSRHARMPDLGMRIAQGVLALLCLLLGIFPTLVIEAMAAIPMTLHDLPVPQAGASGWLWLTPVASAAASYSPPLLLAGVALLAGLFYLLLHGRRFPKVRSIHPWDCGFGPLSPRMQYTAAAFAMPIRRIFKPVWEVEERVERITDPKTQQLIGMRHKLTIGDRSWTTIYEPIGRWIVVAARRIAQLQSGNIRTYLAYSFFTLLFLLWLIT